MEDFYKLVGRVCYCAAKADKVIKVEEIDKMNDLLFDYWSENRQVILDSFYLSINENYEVQNLLKDIEQQKKLTPERFTPVMIDQIMQTAYKIVVSYSSTNKSEIVFISQLRNALEG